MSAVAAYTIAVPSASGFFLGGDADRTWRKADSARAYLRRSARNWWVCGARVVPVDQLETLIGERAIPREDVDGKPIHQCSTGDPGCMHYGGGDLVPLRKLPSYIRGRKSDGPTRRRHRHGSDT